MDQFVCRSVEIADLYCAALFVKHIYIVSAEQQGIF